MPIDLRPVLELAGLDTPRSISGNGFSWAAQAWHRIRLAPPPSRHTPDLTMRDVGAMRAVAIVILDGH